MIAQTKDTLVTISRRVLPDTFVDLYFLKSKAPILLEVKSELKINDNIEPLPPLNPYVCNEDSVIMHTTTLKTVEIQAYPMDAMLEDFSSVALWVFTVWYVLGTFNKWKCFFSDLKSCIV